MVGKLAKIEIPSVEVVKARLHALGESDVREVSRQSGVSFSTLMKIRHGITKNPGIATVKAFFYLLPDCE